MGARPGEPRPVIPVERNKASISKPIRIDNFRFTLVLISAIFYLIHPSHCPGFLRMFSLQNAFHCDPFH
jgi:hypothetical protein